MLATVGLAVITVVSRFFMIPERELPLPDWLGRGLKYARWPRSPPSSRPRSLMVQGELIDTFMDARLPGPCCCQRVLLLAPGHSGHHSGGYGGIPATAHRLGLVGAGGAGCVSRAAKMVP